jgi:hypothetical protein
VIQLLNLTKDLFIMLERLKILPAGGAHGMLLEIMLRQDQICLKRFKNVFGHHPFTIFHKI